MSSCEKRDKYSQQQHNHDCNEERDSGEKRSDVDEVELEEVELCSVVIEHAQWSVSVEEFDVSQENLEFFVFS